MQPLAEDDAPHDPMDPFANEAANRLEQDVLMAANGIRPQIVMRRIARYKKYMTAPAAMETDIVQKYRDQVMQAAAAFTGLTPYVEGGAIFGDALRVFSLVLWCASCAMTPVSCTTKILQRTRTRSTLAIPSIVR